MAKKLLANDHCCGALPLGSKAGNVQSTFNAGLAMDRATSQTWAGDRDTSAGNSRRASGGNKANPARAHTRKNSLGEQSNVNGRSSKGDGQRYGGSPKLSGKTRGPSGIKSKKGRLK